MSVVSPELKPVAPLIEKVEVSAEASASTETPVVPYASSITSASITDLPFTLNVFKSVFVFAAATTTLKE